MKRLIAVLAFAPLVAFAKPVSFEFNGVSLVAFSQAVFRIILGRDFVVAPEVLAGDRRITISVRNIEQADVPVFVTGILQKQGISVVERGGVYYLNQASSTEGATEGQQTVQERAQTMYGAGIVNTAAGQRIGPSGESVRDADAAWSRKEDEESELFEPQHRSSEFVTGVLAASFGKQSATLAGRHVLLMGSKSSVAKMRSLASSLDSPIKMLDVSASWVEVTQNFGQGRGISLAATVLGARFGASIGTVNAGTAISLRNTRFDLVIDALNSDGRFKQVSNSRIAGEDRERFNFTVGDETPTVASAGADNAGNRVQSIVYRPSGVIIDVVPRVLGDGRISMEIDAQISSFKTTSNGVAGSPTLIKRQVKTKVAMADGEVMLLGGLEDSQSTESSSGLSFLPASWLPRSSSSSKTDLVLVVSAKVLPD